MGTTDGYLKIKTKLDNSGVDKDVKNLEDKIKKLQVDNKNNSAEQRSLQEEIDRYNKLTQKADEYNQKIKELNQEKKNMVTANPNLSVGTSPELERLNSQIDAMKQKYAEATNEIDKQAPKIDKVYTKLEKVKSKQEENNAKISEYKAKIDQININKMEQGINSVGKGITKTISKIGKMTLAVFGIRTAFNAVRSAVNTVAQYNPQIAADIDYIKYALSQTLLPVVQKLINLAYTLLSYINAIAQAWFGVNLFANSSAKSFKAGAKAAKEMSKSTQGFDEMNIMADNSSASSGSETASPSMDLSSMQGNRPEWLQWIIDNKELVLGIIEGITAGLISMKLLGLDPLLSLGIGLVVAGVVEAVQGLIKFIKDPTWENFIPVLEGIAIALTGIAIILGVLTGNWIPLIIALVALILAEVIKHWDEIKEVLGKVGQWIYDNVIKPVGDFLKKLWNDVVSGVTNAVNKVKSTFSTMKTFLSNIITTIVNLFKGIGTKVGSAISGAFKVAINAVLATIENVLNTPIKAINSLIGVINAVPGISLGKINTFKLPRLAVGGIVNIPGRGVPIGGAIAGEAGREGVLPLTDPTTMAQLGQEIGKWITVNTVNTIKLGSRIISRQTSKQKNQLAFETNGGVS